MPIPWSARQVNYAVYGGGASTQIEPSLWHRRLFSAQPHQGRLVVQQVCGDGHALLPEVALQFQPSLCGGALGVDAEDGIVSHGGRP